MHALHNCFKQNPNLDVFCKHGGDVCLSETCKPKKKQVDLLSGPQAYIFRAGKVRLGLTRYNLWLNIWHHGTLAISTKYAEAEREVNLVN